MCTLVSHFVGHHTRKASVGAQSYIEKNLLVVTQSGSPTDMNEVEEGQGT